MLAYLLHRCEEPIPVLVNVVGLVTQDLSREVRHQLLKVLRDGECLRHFYYFKFKNSREH